MLPQDIGQQKKKYIFHASSAAIHTGRIAALLLSTKNALCSLISAYNDNPCISAVVQMCFLSLVWVFKRGGQARCRSPPSDFDFANQQKRNWRKR